MLNRGGLELEGQELIVPKELNDGVRDVELEPLEGVHERDVVRNARGQVRRSLDHLLQQPDAEPKQVEKRFLVRVLHCL